MRLWFLTWIVTASVVSGLWIPRVALAQETVGPNVLPPPDTFPAPSLPQPSDAELIAPEEELETNSPSSDQDPVDTTPMYVPMWYEPAYWFGPAPWDVGFELGINGSEGINETLSLRTGGHLKRKSDFWNFDSSLAYNKNSANGVETQNNALLDVRVDRLLGESPWTLYFLNQELYDEFQAFDLRVSLNAGVGYQVIDNDMVELIGRFGAGSSREFGGPDDRWAQEAPFGLDYEHQLSETQRLSATVDYYPEWENFNLYRVVTDIGWEIDLDRPKKMSLKFSVIDRYDSTPNGVEPNEINYAALLIWGL